MATENERPYDEEEGARANQELDLSKGYGLLQEAHRQLFKMHAFRAFGYDEEADLRQAEAEAKFDEAEEALRRGYGVHTVTVHRSQERELLRKLDFALETVQEIRVRATSSGVVTYTSEVKRWLDQIEEALTEGRKA